MWCAPERIQHRSNLILDEPIREENENEENLSKDGEAPQLNIEEFNLDDVHTGEEEKH